MKVLKRLSGLFRLAKKQHRLPQTPQTEAPVEDNNLGFEASIFDDLNSTFMVQDNSLTPEDLGDLKELGYDDDWEIVVRSVHCSTTSNRNLCQSTVFEDLNSTLVSHEGYFVLDDTTIAEWQKTIYEEAMYEYKEDLVVACSLSNLEQDFDESSLTEGIPSYEEFKYDLDKFREEDHELESTCIHKCKHGRR